MDVEKHDKICDLYWDIRAKVQDGPEYARMAAMLEELNPQYEALLETLPTESRQLMERCILLRESMSSRMLEWGCEKILFPET